MSRQKVHMEFNEADKVFLMHRLEFTWAEFVLFLLSCGVATLVLKFFPGAVLIRVVLAVVILLVGFATVYIKPMNRSMIKWCGDAITYSLETKARVWTKTDDYPATQDDLGLQYITDSVCKTDTGAYVALLELQGLHMSTMAFDEREGVSYRFTQFLNTLNFPVQFLVRLRRISFENYLNKLEEKVSDAPNPYIFNYLVSFGDFILEKTAHRNLISRQYYLVVPYVPNPVTLGKTSTKGFFTSLKNLFFPTATPSNVNTELLDADAKKALYERCNLVMRGLTRVGIHSRRLVSNEIREVFYSGNNPRLSERQPWRIDGVLSEAYFPHHVKELEEGEDFFMNRAEFQQLAEEERPAQQTPPKGDDALYV